MKTLEHQTAIVTGAAGGLGRAFALAFAEHGAAVAAADINPSGAQETAALIQTRGGSAVAVPVNVADELSTQAMARQVAAAFGQIDILVNNAAIYAGLERKPFYELDSDVWDRVLAVNLKGVWLCAKAVFPYMKQRGRGKIINLASATVYSGSPQWAHYVASKGAVNALAPGFTLTDASLGLIENAEQYGVTRGALKRAEQADDVVGAALFFASS